MAKELDVAQVQQYCIIQAQVQGSVTNPVQLEEWSVLKNVKSIELFWAST